MSEWCCVGIMEWSENEKMMNYGGVVGRRWGNMNVGMASV